MKNILVVLDEQDIYLKKNAKELISYGLQYGKVSVYLSHMSIDIQNDIANYGASIIFDASNIANQRLESSGFATSIQRLNSIYKFNAILFTDSILNVEIAARLSIKLRCGILTQVTKLLHDFKTEHSPFEGRYKVIASCKSNLSIIVAKNNSYKCEKIKQKNSITVNKLDIVKLNNNKLKIISSKKKNKNIKRPDLIDADIVVAGGYGTNGDFSSLEELADILNAAIGSTRVAVDEGWIEHDTQVGQTGVIVSPKLYIAAGISGAIQQKSGMQSSGIIIAINNDINASIFEICDFGIIGNLHTIVPKITKEISKRKKN